MHEESPKLTGRVAPLERNASGRQRSTAIGRWTCTWWRSRQADKWQGRAACLTPMETALGRGRLWMHFGRERARFNRMVGTKSEHDPAHE